MRIAFWQASEDGSSWYRCEQPAQALRWRGHQVWSSKVLPESQIRGADVVVGVRVAQPGPTAVWRRMALMGKRLVMDFDDDYFSINPDNRLAYDFWTQDEVRQSLLDNMQLAETITCVSEPLAESLREYHPDVRVVPNGLHAMYLQRPRPRGNRHPLTIGWAGTSSTIQEWAVPGFVRALNRILDYNPAGAILSPEYRPRLQLVGATLETAMGWGLTHPHIDAVEWVDPTDRYLEWVNQFDIWVAPYRDNHYNRCKFATKALEANMLGIPLIASNITPYRDWPGPVYLVKDHYDWGRHLKVLVDSYAQRLFTEIKGREAASRFTLQGLGESWERALVRRP